MVLCESTNGNAMREVGGTSACVEVMSSLVDAESLVAYAARHTARGDDFSLTEVLQALSKRDQGTLWRRVLTIVRPLVETSAFVYSSDSMSLSTASTSFASSSSSSSSSDGSAGKAICVLQAATQMASLYTEHVLQSDGGKEKSKPPEALQEMMELLHGIIFYLQGLEGETLQNMIAKVCESWWASDRPGAEHLVVQLLPYLLVKSLEEDATQADVKRVYAVRGALLLFDVEDESCVALLNMVLRCFLSPVYLKGAEGRRFLAYLFGLHPNFVDEIHSTIRNQIPNNRKSVLRVYGDLYFRAWRSAEGQYLLKIENDCVQDLMQCAIHASTPALFSNLRTILASFHENKKQRNVDATLLRLYEPIIWRSLHAANPVVRRQAATLFVDAFPLQDQAASNQDLDSLLQRQFTAIHDLLSDADPSVRVVAVEGSCRILSVFWELIPQATARAMLSTLIGELACDASSVAVRVAVCDGISFLLDCHLSHGVLKALLPAMAGTIHDVSERVRVAFIKLLVRVKAVRAIQFFDIVPVDELLARLAADSDRPAVVLHTTELLLNSYYPQGEGSSGSLQVKRCIAFLRRNAAAATVFYRNIHRHISAGSTAKLCALLSICIRSCVDEQQQKQQQAGGGGGSCGEAAKGKGKGGGRSTKRARQEKDEEEETKGAGGDAEDGGRLSASDLPVMRLMLGTIADLLESVAEELTKPRHEPVVEFLGSHFNEPSLSALAEHFSDDIAARHALMRVMGALPISLVSEALKESAMPELFALGKTAVPTDFDALVTCLCAWSREDELVGFIAAAVDDTPTSKKQQRGRRGKDATMDAALAMKVLDFILKGDREPVKAARQRLIERLDGTAALSEALNKQVMALPTTLALAAGDDDATEKTQLQLSALDVCGKLFLHRAAAKGLCESADEQTSLPFPAELLELMSWASSSLLPDVAAIGGTSSNAAAAAASPAPLSPPKARMRQGRAPRSAAKVKEQQHLPESENAESLQLARSVGSTLSSLAAEAVASGMVGDAATRAQLLHFARSWGALLLAGDAERGGENDGGEAEDSDDEASEEAAAFFGVEGSPPGAPELCRFLYQLSALELQQRRHDHGEGEDADCASVCALEIFLSQPEGVANSTKATVRRCVSGLISLHNRQGGLAPLMERLCSFLTDSVEWTSDDLLADSADALPITSPSQKASVASLLDPLLRSRHGTRQFVNVCTARLSKLLQQQHDAAETEMHGGDGDDAADGDAAAAWPLLHILSAIMALAPPKHTKPLVDDVTNGISGGVQAGAISEAVRQLSEAMAKL